MAVKHCRRDYDELFDKRGVGQADQTAVEGVHKEVANGHEQERGDYICDHGYEGDALAGQPSFAQVGLPGEEDSWKHPAHLSRCKSTDFGVLADRVKNLLCEERGDESHWYEHCCKHASASVEVNATQT
mmetsp:Transcript_22253/g.29799  ORF Transcript_22253/g.29799 Transcript_22253/m.29799 type:complete len:129 (+) Transcript_22253:827-1213(+)